MKIFFDSNLKICDKSFKKTPQGYLLVEGIISRSGFQEYLDVELGVGNSGKIISLYRPVEEVIDPMSVSSFVNMPVTDGHPESWHVTPSNFKKYSMGTVLSTEPTENNQVKAEMIVYDSSLIKKIMDGKRELSAGYTAEIEFSDDGKSAIQRKIRGNHVAFVDAARCGRECSIFDSSPIKGDPKMAKVNINDAEYEMADSLAPVVISIIDENKLLKKKLKDSDSANEKKQAALDEKDEKIKKMEDEEDDEDETKKKISDMAHELLKVMNDANKIIKDFDCTGLSAESIRAGVVISGNAALKDKSQTYLDARFDIMVDAISNSDPLSAAISDSANESGLTDSAIARKKANERKRNAWKGEK